MATVDSTGGNIGSNSHVARVAHEAVEMPTPAGFDPKDSKVVMIGKRRDAHSLPTGLTQPRYSYCWLPPKFIGVLEISRGRRSRCVEPPVI